MNARKTHASKCETIMATGLEKEADAEGNVRSKPPFVRRVRIRGYKSIAFCDVTLEPLTVLVGRNAAGKSNFLDALSFLRDAMETSATEAVKRHGGWSAILCRTSHISCLEFGLEVGLDTDDVTPKPGSEGIRNGGGTPVKS